MKSYTQKICNQTQGISFSLAGAAAYFVFVSLHASLALAGPGVDGRVAVALGAYCNARLEPKPAVEQRDPTLAMQDVFSNAVLVDGLVVDTYRVSIGSRNSRLWGVLTSPLKSSAIMGNDVAREAVIDSIFSAELGDHAGDIGAVLAEFMKFPGALAKHIKDAIVRGARFERGAQMFADQSGRIVDQGQSPGFCTSLTESRARYWESIESALRLLNPDTTYRAALSRELSKNPFPFEIRSAVNLAGGNFKIASSLDLIPNASIPRGKMAIIEIALGSALDGGDISRLGFVTREQAAQIFSASHDWTQAEIENLFDALEIQGTSNFYTLLASVAKIQVLIKDSQSLGVILFATNYFGSGSELNPTEYAFITLCEVLFDGIRIRRSVTTGGMSWVITPKLGG